MRQYSIGDYIFTFIGFIGLAVPSFLLALVVMYLSFAYFGASIGGLFSTEYLDAPWSLARVWDLCKHLWIPALILGTAGTAQLVRILRANLLDELHKPYVVTARAKGLSELRTILKYPVRVALNPFISTIGYTLPFLVSGSIIVSIVLSLPTVGPLLLKVAHRPGHVSGRNHRPAARPHDRRRHVGFRHSAGVDRPAHSVGGVAGGRERAHTSDIEERPGQRTRQPLANACMWPRNGS